MAMAPTRVTDLVGVAVVASPSCRQIPRKARRIPWTVSCSMEAAAAARIRHLSRLARPPQRPPLTVGGAAARIQFLRLRPRPPRLTVGAAAAVRMTLKVAEISTMATIIPAEAE